MSGYFGKYRGKVENNVDPQRLGRIQVSVPAVLGEGTQSWAMPCVPYAGPSVGFFAVPPNDANVWVEFEGGDPDYPIWAGCYWGEGEMPLDPAVPEHKMFRTDGITLSLNDGEQGGVELKVDEPAVGTPITVKFDDNGITVTDDKTKITVTPSDCTVENEAVSLTLSGSELTLVNSEVSITLTDADLKLENGDSSATLTASDLELKSGTPSLKVSGSGVELTNGGNSVKVAASSVSVNDGALEVM